MHAPTVHRAGCSPRSQLALSIPLLLLLLVALSPAASAQALIQAPKVAGPVQGPPTLGEYDAQLLLNFKATFTNGASALSSWADGSDPCGGGWLGVTCSLGLPTEM